MKKLIALIAGAALALSLAVPALAGSSDLCSNLPGNQRQSGTWAGYATVIYRGTVWVVLSPEEGCLPAWAV